MDTIKIYTIGFTKKNAEQFFGKLCSAGVKRLVDIRLNNSSQLAGFAKKDDLKFFLKKICDIEYVYVPQLAPTKEILDEYRKTKNSWAVYEQRFIDLMITRKVQETVSRDVLNNGCLLCSEDTSEQCHRRLVAEYLKNKWGNVEIIHLT
jgi:uncharacterized protein (DUF488 family)